MHVYGDWFAVVRPRWTYMTSLHIYVFVSSNIVFDQFAVLIWIEDKSFQIMYPSPANARSDLSIPVKFLYRSHELTETSLHFGLEFSTLSVVCPLVAETNRCMPGVSCA